MYVVTRTAKRNPLINGQTLYLTNIGMWTLDVKNAWKFNTEAEALAIRKTDVECKVQEV